MAKYFVPDSVAAEVHVREIEDKRIEGLPLGQQLAIIAAYDAWNIEGADMHEHVPEGVDYTDLNGQVGIIEVDDGRGHYYGYVFGKDEILARREADALLDEWLDEYDDEEDDEDDDA